MPRPIPLPFLTRCKLPLMVVLGIPGTCMCLLGLFLGTVYTLPALVLAVTEGSPEILMVPFEAGAGWAGLLGFWWWVIKPLEDFSVRQLRILAGCMAWGCAGLPVAAFLIFKGLSSSAAIIVPLAFIAGLLIMAQALLRARQLRALQAAG